MRSESELLIDILRRLNRAGVHYMLTGSMASNYWGIPRTTHDLNFVLVMAPSQVDQLVAAFQPGFFIRPESVRSAFQPPYQFNFLAEQSTLKADFLLLSETAFEQVAFKRRLTAGSYGPNAHHLIHFLLVGNEIIGGVQQAATCSNIMPQLLSATSSAIGIS